MALRDEWLDFRRTVLHDFDEEECQAAMELFYAGSLAIFNCLVLTNESEDERINTLKAISQELAAFMRERGRPPGRDLYKLFRLDRRHH